MNNKNNNINKNVSACLSFLSPSHFPAFPANSPSKSMTALPASAVALIQMPKGRIHGFYKTKEGSEVRRLPTQTLHDVSGFTTAIHLHCLILSWPSESPQNYHLICKETRFKDRTCAQHVGGDVDAPAASMYEKPQPVMWIIGCNEATS